MCVCKQDAVALPRLLVRGRGRTSDSPVVEHVLKDEEEGDLASHEPDGAEWNLVGSHAKIAADWVEEPNQRCLAGEVGEKNDLCALPDLLGSDLLVGLQLPLVEEGNVVDNEPWDGTAKVHDLVLENISLDVRLGTQRNAIQAPRNGSSTRSPTSS